MKQEFKKAFEKVIASDEWKAGQFTEKQCEMLAEAAEILIVNEESQDFLLEEVFRKYQTIGKLATLKQFKIIRAF